MTPRSELARHQGLAALLIFIGVGCIAASFVWPTSASRGRGWSNEQAKQYQATAGKLHGLSHEIAHAEADREAAVREELQKARAEYDDLREELDAAISQPRRWAWILRVGGVLAVCLGGVLLYTRPQTEV